MGEKESAQFANAENARPVLFGLLLETLMGDRAVD